MTKKIEDFTFFSDHLYSFTRKEISVSMKNRVLCFVAITPLLVIFVLASGFSLVPTTFAKDHTLQMVMQTMNAKDGCADDNSCPSTDSSQQPTDSSQQPTDSSQQPLDLSLLDGSNSSLEASNPNNGTTTFNNCTQRTPSDYYCGTELIHKTGSGIWGWFYEKGSYIPCHKNGNNFSCVKSTSVSIVPSTDENGGDGEQPLANDTLCVTDGCIV